MTKDDSIVTPWEVKGEIDYDKLVKEFGIKPMGELPESMKKDLLFRRGKIFAQRDFSRITDAIKNRRPFVMMTGLMPTGKFHIGHAILAKQFLIYQELGAKLYIAVADVEAYNAREQSLEESREKAIDQYIVNYIALGLKPKNCEIYFQSDRSKNANKSNAYYRLQNLLSRHATYNEFRAVYGEITPGKMLSGLLQAADILHPQLDEFEGPMPVVVPVGIDQDPHIRLARDLAARIKDQRFVQISSTCHFFVPGLNGGKMSSSDPTSFVALTDDEKTVRNKVNKYAFSGGQATIEEHRKKGGNTAIDVPYQWLTFFEEDDHRLKKIHDDYSSGKMLTGELKEILINKLNNFLVEHQKRREKAKNEIDKFIQKD
jgi:tryptophanyl-tRNA synthetase